MSCSKPSGDPAAIYRAADAISAYAGGVGGMFGPLAPSGGAGGGIDLSAFWTGTAADKATQNISQYCTQLDDYAGRLCDYADQLRTYAAHLADAQKCTIWSILEWVFIVVFAIVEIIVGLFGGGIIDAAFATLFASIASFMVDGLMAVGDSIGVGLDAAVATSGFAADMADWGAGLAGSFGIDVADVSGSLGIDLGVDLGADLGANLGGDALASVSADADPAIADSAGIVGQSATAQTLAQFGFDDLAADLTGAGEDLAKETLTWLYKLPGTITTDIANTLEAGVSGTIVNYFEELVIRGIASRDPESGGFKAMWSSNDAMGALAMFSGILAAGLGGAIGGTIIGLTDRALTSIGLDISSGLNQASRLFALTTEDSDWMARNLYEDDWYGYLHFVRKGEPPAGYPVYDLPKLPDAPGIMLPNQYIDIAMSGKLGELGDDITAVAGEEVADEFGTKIVKDAFNEVMGSLWATAAIQFLSPAMSGQKIDWKSFWYYITVNTVKGLLKSPTKAATRSVTDRYVGRLFDYDSSQLKDLPVLSGTAKMIGDVLVDDGFALLRKVTLDPVLGFGSWYAYQQSVAQTETVLP